MVLMTPPVVEILGKKKSHGMEYTHSNAGSIFWFLRAVNTSCRSTNFALTSVGISTGTSWHNRSVRRVFTNRGYIWFTSRNAWAAANWPVRKKCCATVRFSALSDSSDLNKGSIVGNDFGNFCACSNKTLYFKGNRAGARANLV